VPSEAHLLTAPRGRGVGLVQSGLLLDGASTRGVARMPDLARPDRGVNRCDERERANGDYVIRVWCLAGARQIEAQLATPEPGLRPVYVAGDPSR
jgi:hypothetical protein